MFLTDKYLLFVFLFPNSLFPLRNHFFLLLPRFIPHRVLWPPFAVVFGYFFFFSTLFLIAYHNNASNVKTKTNSQDTHRHTKITFWHMWEITKDKKSVVRFSRLLERESAGKWKPKKSHKKVPMGWAQKRKTDNVLAEIYRTHRSPFFVRFTSEMFHFCVVFLFFFFGWCCVAFEMA